MQYICNKEDSNFSIFSCRQFCPELKISCKLCNFPHCTKLILLAEWVFSQTNIRKEGLSIDNIGQYWPKKNIFAWTRCMNKIKIIINKWTWSFEKIVSIIESSERLANSHTSWVSLTQSNEIWRGISLLKLNSPSKNRSMMMNDTHSNSLLSHWQWGIESWLLVTYSIRVRASYSQARDEKGYIGLFLSLSS